MVANTKSKRDQETIASGLFVSVFSAFEVGISDLFVTFAMGRANLAGEAATRYILPRDSTHLRSIMKAGQQHVFWADAGRVIERSADWFEDGFTIGDALKTHKNILDKSRRVRNYIAHGSDEAWQQFRGVWESDVGPIPLRAVDAGKFLLLRKGRKTNPTFFEKYVSQIGVAFEQACGT